MQATATQALTVPAHYLCKCEACQQRKVQDSALASDLKASVFVEQTISKALQLKKKLPAATYRKLTERLAGLLAAEEIEEHAQDINPKTGHSYCCGCSSCMTVFGLKF